MIKLIATDVDGTLLDNNSELPELNKQALLDCKNNNIGVVLATGKSASAIKPLINVLDLQLLQITLNGAVTIDKELNIINAIRIDPEYFYVLLKIIKEKKYKPLIALTNGSIFYDEYDSHFSVFEKINQPIFKVRKLEDKAYERECVSVSVTIKESDPLDIFLREKFSDRLQLVRSGEYFFDILNLHATKGNALNNICKSFNLKKEEVAVFGDSPNDLSMFEYASMRFALKNSYPEVLEKADYIIEENFNCGLAKGIYKYILKI